MGFQGDRVSPMRQVLTVILLLTVDACGPPTTEVDDIDVRLQVILDERLQVILDEANQFGDSRRCDVLRKAAFKAESELENFDWDASDDLDYLVYGDMLEHLAGYVWSHHADCVERLERYASALDVYPDIDMRDIDMRPAVPQGVSLYDLTDEQILELLPFIEPYEVDTVPEILHKAVVEQHPEFAEKPFYVVYLGSEACPPCYQDIKKFNSWNASKNNGLMLGLNEQYDTIPGDLKDHWNGDVVSLSIVDYYSGDFPGSVGSSSYYIYLREI